MIFIYFKNIFNKKNILVIFLYKYKLSFLNKIFNFISIFFNYYDFSFLIKLKILLVFFLITMIFHF